MYGVIDVIKTLNIEVFKAKWLVKIQRLSKEHEFQSELFIKTDNVRDSDFYNVISLITCSDINFSYKIPLFNDLNLCERIVRTPCEIHTTLKNKDMEGSTNSRWLINPFEITKQDITPVLDMWLAAKEYMVEKKGFIDARLFTSCSNSKFNLFNIAEWTDKDSFMEALNHTGYDSHRDKSLAYRLHPSLCERVFFL